MLQQELLHFIRQCPDAFHTAAVVGNRLESLGYTRLSEGNPWQLSPGGRYFVTRNQSSLIAFRIPANPPKGFMITASHGDSPCFKVKPHPFLADSGYLRLNTEPYGGMILESWLDRPLSLSGRVVLSSKTGVESRLLQIDRDLLVIPSEAPHLKSAGDKDRKLNPQVDLLPLLGMADEESFLSMLANELGVEPERILDADLFLHCRQEGCIFGKNKEFLSAPRLDDLLCVFSAFHGFLGGTNPNTIPVFALFDNEEVGSGTKQGAKSTFLEDVLSRVAGNRERYQMLLRSSFLLSCDNGHALHPNHGEKSDLTCRPVLNGGVLLKYNANQKYTTDGVSGAIVRQICEKAGVPLQTYVNRSDIPGGSTLGNLACERVSINSADVGAAQLAMHSAWETAGCEDVVHLQNFLSAFYRTAIFMEQDGVYRAE